MAANTNPFLRFLGGLWKGLDGIRKVLHLVVLLFLFMLFIGTLSSPPPVMPDGAALRIEPYGALVEQLEGDPYDRAVAELVGDGRPQTLVADIVDALEFAKDDDSIDMVYLDVSSLLGGGLVKLQRIAVALEDFKSSGKRVVATADFMSQQGYYLAAHADEVYLHPQGAIMFQGYGRFRSYYKEAIDHLRIDWNVFRVGTHKSFVEPYTRNDMSVEDRESTERLITQLWSDYRNDVVKARNLDEGAINEFATNLLSYVDAAGGDVAVAARDYGLVDELLTRTEMRARMIDYVGADDDEPDMFKSAGLREYLAVQRMLEGGTGKEQNVAVIVASGDILFGRRAPGTIGAESTVELLRRAKNKDSVAAVVLRIDSPGGSAFAADIIADEIEALRAAGKPVVASMSSVAASGGYTIAMNADKILASQATITGSIGVFGMFPTYQRSFDAIGIHTDGLGTTPWSGQFRPDREMSEQTRGLLQLFVEDTYDDFISDVSVSRGLAKDDVDRIGQGQVWTGRDALEHGLIDQIGSLDDAIAVAAGLAELADDYGVIHIEPELSAAEALLVELFGFVLKNGVANDALTRRPSLLERIAGDLGDRAEAMLRFNDPKGMYFHCLCDLQ
ncbi:MAG: signal peptide peptidase SppA [Gammaproteobacteria bacterium]|nr:signal peptide peptidase SppA [Gammaproteobacteria bacterium]